LRQGAEELPEAESLPVVETNFVQSVDGAAVADWTGPRVAAPALRTRAGSSAGEDGERVAAHAGSWCCSGDGHTDEHHEPSILGRMR
jgi:hypothetical protein